MIESRLAQQNTPNVQDSGAGSTLSSTVPAGEEAGINVETPRPSPLPPVQVPATITNNGHTLTATPVTSAIINGQTIMPSGETVTISQGSGVTKVHLGDDGRPIVVIGDNTATVLNVSPVPTQTFAIGDASGTVVAGYRLLIDYSTVEQGHPLTISGTPILFQIDTAGLPVLAVGDSTTTLASPSQNIEISPTVFDGTTGYVVGTQTLAPDRPVTVNGTVISILSSGTKTILYVGDNTMTITEPSSPTYAPTGSSSVTEGGIKVLPTSSKCSAGRLRAPCALALAALRLV